MDAEDFLEPEELVHLRRGPEIDFKDDCDGCQAPLTWVDPAWICGQACTWCAECAEAHGMVCPHCGGALAPRPKRTRSIGR